MNEQLNRPILGCTRIEVKKTRKTKDLEIIGNCKCGFCVKCLIAFANTLPIWCKWNHKFLTLEALFSLKFNVNTE